MSRCPTCGQHRGTPTIDRCVELAAAVAPLAISASYVAVQTGVTMATANNYLSTLAAVGRLRRMKRGAYALPAEPENTVSDVVPNPSPTADLAGHRRDGNRAKARKNERPRGDSNT